MSLFKQIETHEELYCSSFVVQKKGTIKLNRKTILSKSQLSDLLKVHPGNGNEELSLKKMKFDGTLAAPGMFSLGTCSKHLQENTINGNTFP